VARSTARRTTTCPPFTWCVYAAIGCGRITHRVVLISQPRTNADAYLLVGFTSGSLAPGASIGDSQLRFNKTDWAMFDETNDYSWAPPTGAYADTTKVTVYQNGSLVWGTEPR
jgi:endo-1,4-beta-xylanase